ncbi:MAG: hypothetical protein DMG94_06555 [Acidobacteria bacterium]|nr:MAG: hypothetical protein DMG94_06555 [Acidobacteriota bacterium]
MATPGASLNAASQSSLTNLVEQKLRAERIVRVGAGWFAIIAALSMINSLLSMSGAGIRFIFGMGIAQFVDGLAHQAGQTGFALDLVINGFVAGIFVIFWRFARKGEQFQGPPSRGISCLCAVPNLHRHERHSNSAKISTGPRATRSSHSAEVRTWLLAIGSWLLVKSRFHSGLPQSAAAVFRKPLDK